MVGWVVLEDAALDPVSFEGRADGVWRGGWGEDSTVDEDGERGARDVRCRFVEPVRF